MADARLEKVPFDKLLKELGAANQTIASRPDGFRVVVTTCKPCTLPAAANSLISGVKDPVQCDGKNVEQCVTRAWKQQRPVVARQVQGIDSVITQWIIGRPGAVVIAHSDSSVSGDGAACSAAVFATNCTTQVSWRSGVAECSGTSTSLCHQKNARREELGPLRPIEELRCGLRDQCSAPQARTQLCHDEAGTLLCSPR